MNDTPETDSLINRHAEECTDWMLTADSLAKHARRLELQRNEARDTARWLYQHGIATLIEGASRNEWIKEEIK